jgi:hypothetical protein
MGSRRIWLVWSNRGSRVNAAGVYRYHYMWVIWVVVRIECTTHSSNAGRTSKGGKVLGPLRTIFEGRLQESYSAHLL